MGQHRKNISIPDDASDILQALATDCGMDASQCITQLLRRHHNDIRTLFSINVCSHTHDCTRIIETVPNVSIESVPEQVRVSKAVPEPIAVEQPKSSPEPTIALMGSFANAPITESPADELERLRALRPMERMKHSARITELKELLEA